MQLHNDLSYSNLIQNLLESHLSFESVNNYLSAITNFLVVFESIRSENEIKYTPEG